MGVKFSTAKWIWCNAMPQADEYGEFVDGFLYKKGKVVLRISADSNYAAYINGELAAFGQYADYPYDKVYDEVDVSNFCRKGENRIAILVWYYGIDTSFTYYPGNAGLLYELHCDNCLLCESNHKTLARMSRAYRNHRKKEITWQMGLGYSYDATREDEWMTGVLEGFESAIIVPQKLPLRSRPCEKLTLQEEVLATPCKRISDTDIIYDLGKEYVGLLAFELESPCEQEITISYGEHLDDGCVRRIIAERDFSISYRAKEGRNEYHNPFRRFGCRYLQIQSEYPLTIHKMAILPTMYPVKEKDRPILTEIQNKIYDMCVETLRLCMHEHYEDCPWREQALYAMDSRNQMLCGYYAFGEYIFPRSNLELIAKDNRSDGLLSICYPSKHELAIPSFSLHYITACAEYLENSWDSVFLNEIYSKLVSIIEAFVCRLQDGLMPTFTGANYWNFYEWREGLSAEDELLAGEAKVAHQDLILNALLSIALQNMSKIAEELRIECDYQRQAEVLNARIREVFWDAKVGICYNRPEHADYSQLGNSLAVLCGAVTGQEAVELCERIWTDSEMTEVTISMRCFKYDACLKVNEEKYAPIVLKDIEQKYKLMMDYGSTTVWEVEERGQAESLCHGWSALPIYYYHRLCK